MGRTAEANRRGLKSSAKCSRRLQLVCCGLGLLCGRDADKAAVTAFVLELHESGNHCEQRLVFAVADVFAALMLGAALTHQNCARVDHVHAEAAAERPVSVSTTARC